MFVKIKKLNFIVLVISTQFIFFACGSDRAGGDNASDQNRTVAGVVERVDTDRDGDGISNDDEINIYGTNPDNNDTDGDGLSDSDELFVYDTNATNPDMDGDGLSDGEEILYNSNPENNDTDGDGLSDGEEIHLYDTNASNSDSDNDGLTDFDEVYQYLTNPISSDTDGDCLLDSFEILNYETNATNKDTDGDGVEDGFEIYGDLETSCIYSPETIDDIPKNLPANDNLPAGSTLIDALDPTNDSDGDAQANIKETECSEGNPKDASTKCPSIDETAEGRSLVEAGFVYIPGGFDVDGDGIVEKGFWVSSYQAREKITDDFIPFDTVNTEIGGFNSHIQKKFIMVNATTTISPIIHGYSAQTLQETLDSRDYPEGKYLEFSLNLNPKDKKRLSGEKPFLIAMELSFYKIYDNQNKELDVSLKMPSLKQYAQIQQLLNADKLSGGNGNIIRNGLLGIDKNVPLVRYSKIMHEFGEEYKEFLNSIMQMKEGDIILCIGCPWVKPWMGINKDKLYKNPNEGTLAKGSASNIDVGMGVGPKKDDYGVLIRAGEVLDLTIGVAGAVSDSEGKYDGIGFRAATDYID